MPGPFQLPPLPWAENALEPVISARTMGLHYGKHHATYVKNLNDLVAGTRFADMPLEHVIAASVGNDETRKIFNNAAQAWNHAFFWNCLKPRSGGEPPRAIARAIDESFGLKPDRKSPGLGVTLGIWKRPDAALLGRRPGVRFDR